VSDEEDKAERDRIASQHGDEFRTLAAAAIDEGRMPGTFIVYCIQLHDEYWKKHANLLMDEHDIANSFKKAARPLAFGWLAHEALGPLISAAPELAPLRQQPAPGRVIAAVFAASGAQLLELHIGPSQGFGATRNFQA